MSQKLHTDIIPWNPLDIGRKIWSLGGLTIQGGWAYHFVGINDKVDTVDSQTPRTSVHLYKDTKLDKLSVTDGEHSIANGAYAAFCNVEGEAVLYVQGHVNSLHISGDAQVFLQTGAYVDFLNCGAGGFVRIDKGVAVHGLVIMKDGKAVISTMADIYDKVIKEGAIVSHMPDEAVYPMKIRLHFDDLEKRDAFCKQVTEEVRTKNGIDIDKELTLWGVCNCYVLPNEKGWDVYLSSSTIESEDRSVIEARIGKRFDVKDVEVWLNGVSSADLKRQKETAMALEWNRKFQQFVSLQVQVEQLRNELFPKNTDDTDVNFICRN